MKFKSGWKNHFKWFRELKRSRHWSNRSDFCFQFERDGVCNRKILDKQIFAYEFISMAFLPHNEIFVPVKITYTWYSIIVFDEKQFKRNFEEFKQLKNLRLPFLQNKSSYHQLRTAKSQIFYVFHSWKDFIVFVYVWAVLPEAVTKGLDQYERLRYDHLWCNQ